MEDIQRAGEAEAVRRKFGSCAPAILPGIILSVRVMILSGLCACTLFWGGPVSDVCAREKAPEAAAEEGKEGCGLADQAYSFDGGQTWTAQPYVNVKENGIYHVLVRDKLGNTTQGSFEVKNIDREAPTASLSVEPAEFVKEKVKLQVEASDEGSGLADQAYSFDGGSTWCGQAFTDADKNGEYAVKIRDKAGNITDKSITIGNIDREPPVVTWYLEPQKWYEGKAKIIVRAKDEGCGLDAKAFSWDGGQTYHVSGQKEIEIPGRYRVLVRDALGNSVYADIDAVRSRREDNGEGGGGHEGDHSGEQEDSGGRTDESSDQPDGNASEIGKGEFPWLDSEERGGQRQEPADKRGGKSAGKKSGLSGGEREIPEATEDGRETKSGEQDIVTEKKSSKEPVRIAKPQAQDIRRISRWKAFWTSPAGLAAAAVSAAALMSLVALGLYLLFMGIRIYNFDGEEGYCYLGMTVARRREDYFWIGISKRLLEKGTTDEYRLKPGFLFVRLHQGEEMLVKTADLNGEVKWTKEKSLMVEKEMDCIL